MNASPLRTALKSATEKLPGARVAQIISAFADLTGTRPEDLAGSSQAEGISYHRHRLMFLIRRIDHTATFSLIGRCLGDRDMATVHEAVSKVKGMFERVPRENIELCGLETLIRERLGEGASVAKLSSSWQITAAASVLRDDALTDTEARKAALTFLSQLEGSHA